MKKNKEGQDVELVEEIQRRRDQGEGYGMAARWRGEVEGDGQGECEIRGREDNKKPSDEWKGGKRGKEKQRQAVVRQGGGLIHKGEGDREKWRKGRKKKEEIKMCE